MHHDERRAAAKEEFRAKLQAKVVDDAVHYHGTTRAASHAEVDQLLLGNAGGKQVKLLLAQIKDRTVGCGYEYEDIEINLKSSLATAERRDALKALLLEMIEVDNADTKRRAVPDDPSVPEGAKGFATTVRQLGPATKKRQEHDEILARRVEEMVQQEDDGVLLELENKHVGKRFIDGDGGGEEYREIEGIEWNDDRSAHVAAS